MNILLTNDDGFESEGLSELAHALSQHEVWIVAPDGERSGMSHSITLHRPVRFVQMADRAFTCSGNPADCVLYSLQGGIPVRPDAVISGINLGPNLGTDLIYSGTAAASRQAVLMGIPGIAVSQVLTEDKADFRASAEFIADNIEKLCRLWKDSHFININIPAVIDSSTEISVTKPSRRGYNDVIESFTAPDGSIYHFLRGNGATAEEEDNGDWTTVSLGKISVSPIRLHPQIDDDFSRYQEVFG